MAHAEGINLNALRDYWYPIALSTDVQDKPLAVVLLGADLVLWRTADGIHAFKDLCVHRGNIGNRLRDPDAFAVVDDLRISDASEHADDSERDQYLDQCESPRGPSHRRPLPEALLSYALSSIGSGSRVKE